MFITEEETLKILTEGDSKLLNEVLERVYNKAVEKALLMLPEVVGRLGKRNEIITSLLKQFLSENKNFLNHKELVLQVVQEIEIKNPSLKFDEILLLAKPTIEQKIKLLGGV